MIRERGPAWDASRHRVEQDAWEEHAAFMDGLADEGFVVLGGPLEGEERFMLVVDADSEDAVHARLAADPWTGMGLLRTASVTPWEILLGEAR
ncbi:MAG TPA: YciI family protein [Geminicoccaceae bacterium]|nr:YciI family protein [Geminicoccaceae bacterium]